MPFIRNKQHSQCCKWSFRLHTTFPKLLLSEGIRVFVLSWKQKRCILQTNQIQIVSYTKDIEAQPITTWVENQEWIISLSHYSMQSGENKKVSKSPSRLPNHLWVGICKKWGYFEIPLCQEKISSTYASPYLWVICANHFATVGLKRTKGHIREGFQDKIKAWVNAVRPIPFSQWEILLLCIPPLWILP